MTPSDCGDTGQTARPKAATGRFTTATGGPAEVTVNRPGRPLRSAGFLRVLCASASGTFLALALTASAACGRKATVQTPRPSAAPQVTAPSPPPAPAPAQPTPAGTPPADPPAPPSPPPISVTGVPQIRIGIASSASETRISAPGRYFLQEKALETGRRTIQGDITIRVESRRESPATAYRVQVASLSRKEPAEELGRKLEAELQVPAVVREGSNERFQVRVGEFESRQEAQKYAAGTLKRAGYPDAFVVQDHAAARGGETTLALRGPNGLLRLNRAGFLIYPASDMEFLRLEGRPYRGLLDVSLNKSGRIMVVNQLGMEEYLFGVVPAEMSPATYPAEAALAAQAIAARTYALKNLGRFRSEGYDLTDDTRTQVYGGVAAERDPTNEVVRKTAGMAVYYQGRLIDAMYASTCGGRTEDFAAVYDAAPVPYLTSVLCAVESEVDGGGTPFLRGKHALDRLMLSSDGRLANREIELALLLDLAIDGSAAPEYFEAPALEAEVIAWVDSARRLLRRTSLPPQASETGVASNSGFVRYCTESIFGTQNIRRGISDADAAYYLGNLKDGAGVPETDRRALAFALQKGLWLAPPDHSVRPLEQVLRKDAVATLVRAALSARPDILNTGTLSAFVQKPGSADGDAGISVRWGAQTKTLTLAAEIRLFQRGQGRSAPAESLRLIGNEKLGFRLNRDGKIDFLEVELNPTGAASDRFSPVAVWQAVLSRAQLGDKLSPLARDAGEIQDLEPERIGKSGRAVQVRVIGSRRSVTVNGYKVRNALGLRDTLFTIRREYGASGKVERFVFDGRGYGHGVGLCQVGAFGMARAGRSYEEILKTYYQGVVISRAY